MALKPGPKVTFCQNPGFIDNGTGRCPISRVTAMLTTDCFQRSRVNLRLPLNHRSVPCQQYTGGRAWWGGTRGNGGGGSGALLGAHRGTGPGPL